MNKKITITTDVDIDVADFLLELHDSDIISEYERRNLDESYLENLDDDVIIEIAENRGIISVEQTSIKDMLILDFKSLMNRREYKEILIMLEREIPEISGISDKVKF
jgi:uncharacterized protein YuzE